MKTLPRLILLATLPALTLAGCKKESDQPKAAAGTQLLPRSVSDDMLPYDTVRSQASLSAPDAAIGGSGVSGADDGADIPYSPPSLEADDASTADEPVEAVPAPEGAAPN